MQEPREFEILRRIREGTDPTDPSVIVGPGDDAAVLRPPPGRDLVFTTDTLTEGVHFRQGWCPADALGFKAVVQSLSDLAAMAARPLALCAALAMPEETPDAWVDGFVQGLRLAAGRWACPLVGGNLSRAADSLSVTVSLLGTVAPGKALLRSSGRPGDALLLTGWPGLASAAYYGDCNRADHRHAGSSSRPIYRATGRHYLPVAPPALGPAPWRYRVLLPARAGARPGRAGA